MANVLLIDGNSLVHAAQYSTPLYCDGKPTHAIIGFLKSLHLVKTSHPAFHEIRILWDAKAHWRYAIYPDYKGTRNINEKQIEAKEQIAVQTPSLTEGLKLLGVPQYIAPGFEADDLAGYFCRRLNRTNRYVRLITGDEDWLQLVNLHTSWLDPRQGAKKKFNRMNFEATGYANGKLFLLGKALQGDTSDNITGVGGIGKVTAEELVRHYGGVKDLLTLFDKHGCIDKEMLPKPLQRARKKIEGFCRNGRHILARNLKLMNLLTDERDTQIAEALTITQAPIDWDGFEDWCMELDFKSILMRRDQWLETFGAKAA